MRDNQATPVTRVATAVMIPVSVLIHVKADASQMVVVTEAGETVTRPLMIRVTEGDGVTEIKGAIVASREGAAEGVTTNPRETVVVQEADRRTRASSS